MADKRKAQELWADLVWDALWEVHPRGATPKELRKVTGLNRQQIQKAAKYLREHFYREKDPPIVYVRRRTEDVEGNCWYIAPTWQDHSRSSISTEYLRQSFARLGSADQLLARAERAFPRKSRRIRKVRRNTAYLREELEDLLLEI